MNALISVWHAALAWLSIHTQVNKRSRTNYSARHALLPRSRSSMNNAVEAVNCEYAFMNYLLSIIVIYCLWESKN